MTRSGFEHYYELDYAGAIGDFERVLASHPDDPFAANHLAAALLFGELYRAGVLETGLYTSNGFLSNRTPVHLDPHVDARVQQLLTKAIDMANRGIAADPNDAQAYYARGVARGLEATYIGMVRKSWFAALGDAKGARRDHEKVLALDPNYSDACLIVGMHSYIVGSLPWALRVLAHVVGESGNKARGITDLYIAARGNGEASVDARAVLGLFLRREQRYQEALENEHELAIAHPRNFLFALEEANIFKNWGKAQEAIAAYRKIIASAQAGEYFSPQLEFAYYGLGESLRGQNDFLGAAEAYDNAASFPHGNPDLGLRAELAAGQMDDLLQKRGLAIQKYRNVIAQNSASEQAAIARRNLKQPYRN